MSETSSNPQESAGTPVDGGMSFANLSPGQLCGGGRYQLKAMIGRGGMGVVWRALDLRLQEEVALKFLPPEIQHDASALEDMRRETLKSHKLSHPHIIRIHDLVEPPGEAPFISMEFVDGANLTTLRMQQRGEVFPWEFLKPLVTQLCSALDYAHSEGVIHRDLKPGNIMLDPKGRLKLADFGIATIINDSVTRISSRHSKSGTVTYSSPQQMIGELPQPTDDIYALGATLYELLTSRPPFYMGDVRLQVQHEEPKPLEERLAELELTNPVPADVSALILACLGKEPSQRPQSARMVAGWIGLSLEEHAGESIASLVGVLPPGQTGNARRPSRWRKASWALAAGLALVAAAGGTWWWHSHRTRATGQFLEAQFIVEEPEEAEPTPGTNAIGVTAIDTKSQTEKPRAPAGGLQIRFENNEFVVTGTGYQMASFKDKARSYVDLKYVLRDVPAALKGWNFTRSNGIDPPAFRVRAKRKATLYAVGNRDELQKQPPGWQLEGSNVNINGANNPNVPILKRNFAAGEEIEIISTDARGILLVLKPKS